MNPTQPRRSAKLQLSILTSATVIAGAIGVGGVSYAAQQSAAAKYAAVPPAPAAAPVVKVYVSLVTPSGKPKAVATIKASAPPKSAVTSHPAPVQAVSSGS